MNIVFFTHPNFFEMPSMLRFSAFLSQGMKERGHTVQLWKPEKKFFNLPMPGLCKRWPGYIDQFIVFPYQIRKKLKDCSNDTLFVFTDNALGPWVPLVAKRPHVIHCHDFLAQKAAQGKILDSKVSWSGSLLQKFIRRGYLKGRYFISVSKQTQEDLHHQLLNPPLLSKVVYNFLNPIFAPHKQMEARMLLGKKANLDLSKGYLLHIGGNHWYKNRRGVVEIYEAWRSKQPKQIPLIMIGEMPSRELLKLSEQCIFCKDIHWLTNINDKMLPFAYSGASVFLFPSLAEGFGWPIAEAMACNCPVVTTNAAPMTEVGGKKTFFVSRRPLDPSKIQVWANGVADTIDQILDLPTEKLDLLKKEGFENSKRFDRKIILDQIEMLYESIFSRVRLLDENMCTH